MSEGFNLPETRRFIRTNKEKETKEHERQDFWSFAACGRSFMLPIAILPVAGLLLGIGSSFTNETTIATYGLQKILGSGTLLNSLLIIMNKVGSAVFDNLPLILRLVLPLVWQRKRKRLLLFLR